ncbi:retrovirus-related pol polyprotein from transposon TNT 1-94 [Tanacetum coccineum]
MQGTKLRFKTAELWFKMNAGGQNRGGNVNPGQAKPIKCCNCNELGHIARECEQVTKFDDDVDDPIEKDLALNVDHIFEVDQYPIYDEAGPSYDYVVDSDAEYASDSNIILYNQYMEDNKEHVVQSNVYSVRNDALMSIIDDMHEQGVQSMLANKQVKVVNDTLTSELARYKELVRVYEKQTKFELTEREQKINEQMRIIIFDRNRKETSLKSELYNVQMQLLSTVNHNKSMKEEVTTLKKDFKQK